MANRINKDEVSKQFTAADKRIKGISSIANSTIRRSRVLEVEKQYGTIKGNKQAVTSVDKALSSLTKSTQALAMGVKTITVETARGIKNITQTGANVIGEYTKALGQDIHLNREGMFVALTAKTTPLIGYAIAKLFETSVFRNMIEKMKSGLGRALNSVSSRFKRLASAGWEKSKEFFNSLRDSTSKKRGSIKVKAKNAKKNISGQLGTKKTIEAQVPHMAKGGYVQKEGLAKVHAAEIVQPVDKIVETIVEQVNRKMDKKERKEKNILTDTVFDRSKGKAKDLFGFEKVGTSIRNTFEIFTRKNLDLERNIMRRDKTEKRGMIASFVGALSEEAKQEELPLMERQVQATIELKKTISGQSKITQAAWQKMLYEHPVFHAVFGLSKVITSTMALPVKFLFKKRGIYANRLSSRGTVFERLLDAMTNTYTGLMEKMDGVLGNTYISAAAAAKANDGKTAGITRAPKQPGYTIIGAGLRLAGKVGKKGLGIASKIGKWTIGSKMSQEEWDEKTNLVGKVKNKYNSSKEKIKEILSKKVQNVKKGAEEKRDSLLERGKSWWNIKNLEDQKKYDFKRDFEKKRNKGKKQLKKLERKEWLEDQKKKFHDKLELYKEYTKEQNKIYRKSNRKFKMDESKWREDRVKGGTINEQFNKRKKEYEDYKNKRETKAEAEKIKNPKKNPFSSFFSAKDKDNTGTKTIGGIFKKLNKLTKKNYDVNLRGAKSQEKLTKFTTGWRKFLPFIKGAIGMVGSAIASLTSMLFSGIGVIITALGASWLWKGPAKMGGVAMKWISSAFKATKDVALKTGGKVVETGLKTKVGQKIATSTAGVAAGKVASKIAAKKVAAQAAKAAAVKTGVKTAAKTTSKLTGRLIPGIGAAIGLSFVASRLKKGQFMEAGLELISTAIGTAGALSAAPTLGLGTAASVAGMVGIETILYKMDKRRNKKDSKYKNLDKSTVAKIKKIQGSVQTYLPLFAGFTGSTTAMLSAAYLNRVGVNNPEGLVKAANKVTGVSKKAWVAAGGSAAIYEGAEIISKSKSKILKLWDKKKGIFSDISDKALDMFDEGKDKAEGLYSKSKKYAKKQYKNIKDKELSKTFNEYKEKAFDAADNAPALFSKLRDGIVSAFMEFSKFMKDVIGDPQEHYRNMRDKVFAGISKARESLSSIYSKIHDIFEILRTEMTWKQLERKARKAKEAIGFPDFNMPTFQQAAARISASGGVGMEVKKDTNVNFRLHKGETSIMGDPKGINFVSPDKVREGLFGGLGIDSKKVATMAARKDILGMDQTDKIKTSIDKMKDTFESTNNSNANMLHAVVDNSIRVASSSVSSGGSGDSTKGPRRMASVVGDLLAGRIT